LELGRHQHRLHVFPSDVVWARSLGCTTFPSGADIGASAPVVLRRQRIGGRPGSVPAAVAGIRRVSRRRPCGAVWGCPAGDAGGRWGRLPVLKKAVVEGGGSVWGDNFRASSWFILFRSPPKEVESVAPSGSRFPGRSMARVVARTAHGGFGSVLRSRHYVIRRCLSCASSISASVDAGAGRYPSGSGVVQWRGLGSSLG